MNFPANEIRTTDRGALFPLNEYSSPGTDDALDIGSSYFTFTATEYRNDRMITMLTVPANKEAFVQSFQVFSNNLNTILITDADKGWSATDGNYIDSIKSELALELCLSPVYAVTGVGSLADPFRITVSRGKFLHYQIEINDGFYVMDFPFNYWLDQNETLCIHVVNTIPSAKGDRVNFRLRTRVFGIMALKGRAL